MDKYIQYNNYVFVKKWLLRKIKHKQILLIIGSNGSGKTYTITELLKELDYDVLKITSFNIPKSKNVGQFIRNYIGVNNIFDYINDKKKKKKIIVIDNLESLYYTAPTSIHTLINILDNSKQKKNKIDVPTIIISNNIHQKILIRLKKISIMLYFDYCSENIPQIIKKYNILKTDNTQDIRQIIYNSKLTYENTNNDNLCLLKTTSKLLTQYNNIQESTYLFNIDTFKIPLMIHQNFLLNILQRKTSTKNKLQNINKIYKNLIFADRFDNIIYGDQYWELLNIHALISCSYISYLLNKLPAPEYYKFKKIKFTEHINKYSIIHINKKNIYNLQYVFPDYNITNLYLMAKVFIYNIFSKNGDINKVKKIVKNYNLKIQNIECLLKLDKIDTNHKLNNNILKKIFTN